MGTILSGAEWLEHQVKWMCGETGSSRVQMVGALAIAALSAFAMVNRYSAKPAAKAPANIPNGDVRRLQSKIIGPLEPENAQSMSLVPRAMGDHNPWKLMCTRDFSVGVTSTERRWDALYEKLTSGNCRLETMNYGKVLSGDWWKSIERLGLNTLAKQKSAGQLCLRTTFRSRGCMPSTTLGGGRVVVADWDVLKVYVPGKDGVAAQSGRTDDHSAINSVIQLSDGRIVTGSDGGLRVWRLDSPQLKKPYTLESSSSNSNGSNEAGYIISNAREVKGGPTEINCMAELEYSEGWGDPKVPIVAIGRGGDNGYVDLYAIPKESVEGSPLKLIRKFSSLRCPPSQIMQLKNGNIVAAAGGYLRMYPKGHDQNQEIDLCVGGYIHQMEALSRGGFAIGLGGYRKGLKIYSAKGLQLFYLKTKKDDIVCIKELSDGRIAFAGEGSSGLKIWDPSLGEDHHISVTALIDPESEDSRIDTIQQLPDGTLVTADNLSCQGELVRWALPKKKSQPS